MTIDLSTKYPNVDEVRKAIGKFNSEEVALALDTTRQTIWGFTTGRTKEPSYEFVTGCLRFLRARAKLKQRGK